MEPCLDFEDEVPDRSKILAVCSPDKYILETHNKLKG